MMLSNIVEIHDRRRRDGNGYLFSQRGYRNGDHEEYSDRFSQVCVSNGCSPKLAAV